MLKQLPVRVNTSLVLLNANEDFQVLCGWLEDSLSDLHAQNANTKDEVLMRWQQGGIQVLTDLLGRTKKALELEYNRQKK